MVWFWKQLYLLNKKKEGTTNKCKSEYASCVSFKNGDYISYGFTTSQPNHIVNKVSNGHYRLTYSVIDSNILKCNQSKSSSMNINLLCPKTRVGVSEIKFIAAIWLIIFHIRKAKLKYNFFKSKKKF